MRVDFACRKTNPICEVSYLSKTESNSIIVYFFSRVFNSMYIGHYSAVFLKVHVFIRVPNTERYWEFRLSQTPPKSYRSLERYAIALRNLFVPIDSIIPI